MSREECEAKILEKLNEIKDICLEFNSEETHISMAIIKSEDDKWYYSAFSVDKENNFYDLDLKEWEE